MARLHPCFAVAPAALMLAPLAAAAGSEEPQTLFGRPVVAAPEPSAAELERRRQTFEAGLEAQGLVLSGDVVMTKAQAEGVDALATTPGAPAAVWDKPAHRSTIFLNFFGGPLKGGKNASEGESPCLFGDEVDWPKYSGSEQKALAIIQVFKDAAAPFGLRIAYEDPPPKHLPYSQVIMGGTPELIGLGSGVLGVSCNLDCGDRWLRDTTFAFTEESNSVGILGTTALQEAAHSFGLDHIDGANNIMYPFATIGAKVWADTCTPFNNATGNIGCIPTHTIFCPDGTSQNDVAELTAYFGLNTADTEAPVVTMLAPLDGQQLSAGDTLHIEVEVSDNFEGYGWVLQVPELNQVLQAYKGEKVWDFPAPSRGAYTIRVEAVDHDGNVGFAEAKVYVDVDPPAADSGDMPTSGGSDGAESSDSSGADDTADTAAEEGEAGCSCHNATSTGAPAWLLVVGGALVMRRRRTRRPA